MPAIVHHLTRQVGSLVLVEWEDVFVGGHFRVVGRMLGKGVFGVAVAVFPDGRPVHVLQFSDNRLFRYTAVRWTVYLVLFAAVFYYFFNNVSQEFIYFQF